MRIEHIGIAVKDLEATEKIFKDLFGAGAYKREEVASEGVLTSFFRAGESKIELLAATRPDSTIAKFIEKKGEGMHHIAFAVVDVEAEVTRLSALGYTVIGEGIKRGADNKLICFLHPKSMGGVLVELCQEAT